jgi:hypothetical protein
VNPISRRTFVATVALCAPAAQVLGATRASFAPVSLDAFIALSERLLGRTGLDRDVAKIYLDALNAGADSAPTLAYLVEINNNPTPEMRSLSFTIVEWWYTGVYTVNDTPRLATHTGALVWSAMSMPAPGTCAGAFGAWSRPPSNA